MRIGVPKEIKTYEYRVGLIPKSVRDLTAKGHEVVVQRDAGWGIGFYAEDYDNAGAQVVDTIEQVYQSAELIVKVKEPQPVEYPLIQSDHVLFTYLHLAPDPQQTHALIESGCTAIAYETVTDQRGGLPLLSPMSDVAGRLSIQAGARCLEMAHGGSGVLLGGVPGVERGNVVVIGGGVVGTNAARMAMGKEAHVTVLDKSIHRLQDLDFQFGAKLNTIFATNASIIDHVVHADLVIGAVLVPGKSAPKLITRDMLKQMRPGSVVVDVAIDQGGCFETSRPTSHDHPTYKEEGIVHYCVSNMPGAVPRTATLALNNATLPFIVAIADKGYKQAMKDDPHLLNGLSISKGRITYQGVAEDQGLTYIPPEDVIKE